MEETAAVSHPALALVHGLSGSRRWWRHTIAALNDRRIVAVDLVGFGDRRGSGPFRLERAADDLAESLAGEAAGGVDVVGHSLGGVVAAQLAADHPALVHRLVLVAAPVVPFRWGVTRHVGNLLRSVPTVVPRFVPLLARDAVRAGPMTIASAAHQLLAADISDRLPRIEVPTLLVWGSRDRLVPPDVGGAVASRIPHSRLEQIRGAGHVPMWERPHAFNSILRRFLDEPDPDR